MELLADDETDLQAFETARNSKHKSEQTLKEWRLLTPVQPGDTIRPQHTEQDILITDAHDSMHAVVEGVEVHTVPFTSEEGGEPWDLFSGPDLYYEAYGPDGTLLHASEVTSDVRPNDLPVPLGGEFSVEASGPYVLRLLDADLTGEEVIGQVVIDPERLVKKGQGSTPPRIIRLKDRETTLSVTLTWREVTS